MEGVLSQQRYSNDKSGLGYSKFSKPSSNKTIFVKASDQPIQEKVNKPKIVHHYPKKKTLLRRGLILLGIEIILNQHAFIVVLKAIHLMLAILETLVLLMGITYG